MIFLKVFICLKGNSQALNDFSSAINKIWGL
ncbi:hypothetical protein EZS27_002117 [termite gut metagenome]|uniref:Uncharacterized protein n=1 Tax=termite gut metagenome TaxID=433724 RepID=A0A5J4SZ54_9ZZZZ